MTALEPLLAILRLDIGSARRYLMQAPINRLAVFVEIINRGSSDLGSSGRA
ncbi:MAG: hypothetical protein IT206_05055 [Fimbriimonadaceae bacterium]|nr:hypothetical protein [Fimbriimonadaceae bacterium]